MEPRTLQALWLTAAILGQTVLLVGGWGFLCATFVLNPLIASDHFAFLMVSKQTEITSTVSLIATILSLASTAFLSIAFQQAPRHRMQKSISLVELSSGIALTRCSFIINFPNPVLALVTLAVFAVTRLLVSSWTAMLTPTLLTLPVNASGWELDLTNSWFESRLQEEILQSGTALVRGNSTEIFNLNGVLSGIAAAQYSFGTPGIFNFNGAKYNISTGGILPAAPGYGGTTKSISSNNTDLAFAGGQVPIHLDVKNSDGLDRQGLSHKFTLLQQGLTANVTCRQTNGTADNLHFNSSFIPIPIPLANGSTDYWLWAWNITADCDEGLPAQQHYVTESNSSTVPQDSSSGFLPFLVCPYPLQQTEVPWEHFTVIANARWRYGFLPQTICKINPLVTTSFVNYSNGVINTRVISRRPIEGSNANLTRFLAAIVNHQSETTQGLTTNAIGDALYAIYISALDDTSTGSEDVIDLLLKELEQYWRGVVEFSGTFLRSAFSVKPDAIPIDARIPLSGNKTITTMGWYPPSVLCWYMIVPISIVALMTYAAVCYTLWHVFVGRGHESFTEFDPSNPIHVIMVSSARDVGNEAKDYLDDSLAGFEPGGIDRNENVRVQLTNVDAHRKRFKVTDY